MALSARQIAEMTDGRLHGSADLVIASVQTVGRAQPGQLTFIGDDAHARRWADSGATVALVKQTLDLEPGEGRALVAVEDVDLALAEVLRALAPAGVEPDPGVHASAVVESGAAWGEDVRIGAHSFVGRDASIGRAAVIHPNVTVMPEASIGEGCVLWPGVVVRERCEIAAGTVLHPGVVIGADGFGYRPAADASGLVKIPQIGTVVIGRDCEIGANTCIDRGKFAATEIGDGCKIDNLVQIGHNCRLGRSVVIAGQTGLAGSVDVGDGVVIGGACDIKDHVSIGTGAKIAGGSQVMADVPAGETWAGSPAQEYHHAGREYAAVRQLPDLLKKFRKHLKSLDA